MEKFNVVADWYFCRQIQAEPKETQLFLSLLEYLCQGPADASDYYNCFQDLSNADIRMQIYAFPKVAALLGDPAFPFDLVKDAAAPYFNNLSAVIAVDISPAFIKLFKLLYAQEPDIAALLKQMKLISGKFPLTLAALPEAKHSAQPYAEIYDRCAEIILLTVCKRMIVMQPGANEEISENALFKTLYLGALDGKIGRLPLLLAADLSLVLPMGLDRNAVLNHLDYDPQGSSFTEPDVVAAYCTVYFVPDKEENESVLNALFREYEKLKHFVTIYEKLRRKAEPDAAKTALVLWQSALVTTAASVDPVETANRLRRFWELSDRSFSAPMKAGNPFGNYYLEKEIRNLLIELKTSRGASVADDAYNNAYWLFYSPFLLLRRESPQPGANATTYLHSDESTSWIRLAASLFNAISILKAIPEDSRERKSIFIDLIAHVNLVISDYRGWLKRAEREETEANRGNNHLIFELSPAIGGLALTCWRQIKYLTSGFSAEIGPQTFINHFRLHRQRNPQHVNLENSSEKRIFHEYAFPVITASWIYDAYLGAMPGAPAAPWLSFLPELYRYVIALPTDNIILDQRQKTQLAVLTRFLCPPPYPDFSMFDWKSVPGSIPGSFLKWRAPFNYFLLNQEKKRAKDWEQESWRQGPRDSSDGRATLFIRAMERFISVRKNNPGGVVDEAKRNVWDGEFRELVTNIKHTQDMSRFARLRLIEVIGDPAVWTGNEDLQELIVYLLIEFGLAYDIFRLAETLLPHRGGKLFEIDAFNNEARQILLQAIFNDKNLSMIESITGRETKDNFKQKTEGLKKQVIEQIKARVAASALPSVRSVLIAANLKNSERLTNEKQLKNATVPAFYQDDRDQLEPGDLFGLVQIPHEIQALTFDVNNKTATVFHTVGGLTGLTNLFRMDREDIFSKSSYQNVLGVCAGIRSANGTGYALFNCGLPDYLEKSAIGQSPVDVGDLVKLQNISLTNGKWEIAGWQLLPKKTEASYKMLNLEYVPVDRRPFVQINLCSGNQRHNIAERLIDQDSFFPDTSRFFYTGGRSSNVYSYFNGKTYEPVWGGLPDLLLEADGHESFTLTYITERTLQAKTGWLFSLLPGRNFLLFEDDFYSDSITNDSSTIQSKLRELHRYFGFAQGLLVTLKIVFHHHRTSLKLLSFEKETQASEWQGYPALNGPFDMRNIYWKRWFKIMDEEEDTFLTAIRGDDGCYLAVKAERCPGFPNISLPDIDPRDAYKEVIVENNDWGTEAQRTATVKAEVVSSNSICQADERRLARFVPEYLAWEEGSPVSLTMLLGANWLQAGELNCLTAESIAVRLELESLTMKPVRVNLPITSNVLRERRYVISRLSAWKKVRLSTDGAVEFRLLTGDFVSEQMSAPGQSLTGVIIEKPRTENGAWCTVAWMTPAGIAKEVIHLDNLAAVRYYPGYKIVAGKDSSGVYCTIFKRDVSVRALWSIDNIRGTLPRDLYFLFEEDGFCYYQYGELNGRIVKVQAGPGNPPKTKKLEDIGFSASPADRYNFGRSVLTNNGQLYVTGFARNVNGVNLKRTAYQSFEFRDGWDIQRYFILEGRLELSNIQPVSVPARQKMKAAEDNYLADPVVIRGTYHIRKDVVIPDTADPLFSRENWYSTTGVSFPIGKGRGSFISEVNYDPDSAEFFLFRQGDTLCADLVNERNFQTPENFRREFIGQRSTDRFYPLYYIGKRTINSQTENPGFLFEWGYGRQVFIPVARLYINGTVASADPELFFGDKVYDIAFWTRTILGQDTLVINIEKFQIEYCDTSLLYLQRKRHKMIHVLKIEKTGPGNIRIKQVMGFPEKDSQQSYYFKVRQPHFKLSTDQTAKLIKLFERMTTTELQVYGRINLSLFENHSLTYELVDFDERDNAAEPDECIPLLAMEKQETKNDTTLILSPLDNQMEPSARLEIPLRRRKFSVRENLLTKLPEENLKGKIYFVRLRTGNQGLYASLIDAPARKTKVLRDLVGAQLVVYGVINKIFDERMIIELKAGVIIQLYNHEFEFMERALSATGDRIRVEQHPQSGGANGRLLITLAASGDQSFITETPRACVLLPKNNLAKRSDYKGKTIAEIRQKISSDAFVIGGLPNIITGISSVEPEKLIVALMSSPHPKTGSLVLRNGRSVLSLSQQFSVGRLNVNEQEYTLSAFLSDAAPNAPIAWERASFATCGVKELIERIRQLSWTFHDTHTFCWVFSEDRISEVTPDQKIPRHRSETGPLFFDHAPRGYRLRYQREDFPRFAYPVQALIEDLERKPGNQGRYPFAGQTPDGRYWIELSPGRIAEFTPKLTCFETPNKLFLENFAWQNVSQGDWISLKLLSGDPAEPEELALLSWEPSFRDLLPTACIAPARYALKGELAVGAGAYIFRLPTMSLPREFEGLVALDETNELWPLTEMDYPRNALREGYTVFLDAEMHIIGFLGLQAIPDPKQAWAGDPLQKIWFEKDEFCAPKYTRVVNLLGGAIPVTVSAVKENGQGTQLHFNRKQQVRKNFIRENEICQAIAIGMISEDQILMQCGSQLFIMNAAELVPALPESSRNPLISVLAKQQIWIRCVKQALLFGFAPEEDTSEIRVEVVADLDEPGDKAGGLICRSVLSGKLYWAPTVHLAWAPIPAGLLKECFPPGLIISAKLIPAAEDMSVPGHIASIVLTNGAMNEFKRFRIGTQFVVRPAAPASGEKLLVRTVGSGMILACAPLTDRDPGGNGLLTVTARSVPRLPFRLLGSYDDDYRLDLPSPDLYTEDGLEKYTLLQNNYENVDELTLLHRLVQCQDFAASLHLTGNELEEHLFVFHRCLSMCRDQLTVRQLDYGKEMAASYLKRCTTLPVIHLSFATIAILILHKTGHDTAALAFTREICARALRSAHVPVIMDKMSAGAMRDIEAVIDIAGPRNTNLRFRALRANIRAAKMTRKDFLTLITFCTLVTYRHREQGQDMEVLANALLAAAGREADIGMIIDNNSSHLKLLKLYRVFVLKGEEMKLLQSHIEILEQVLHETLSFPVLLLDNLTGNMT